MSTQPVNDEQFAQIESLLREDNKTLPVQSGRILVLQKLTATQRNLMLIKAVETPGVDQMQDIATLLHAGAQINYQKRSAPHWTPLDLALHSKNLPLTTFLLEQGAVSSHQIIHPKKGSDAPSTLDFSKNAWHYFWHEVISKYSFDEFLHFKEFAKKHQHSNWGKGLHASAPTPQEVLKAYLDSNSWTYAQECQQHFATEHSNDMCKAFNAWLDADPGLTWRISERHGARPELQEFLRLIEKNIAHSNQKGINVLYDTCILSDNDKLLSILLLARKAPEQWQSLSTGSNYGYHNNKEPLPLLFFGYQQKAEKCLKILEQLPFIVQMAQNAPQPPQFLARLSIEQLKKLESLGISIDHADEKKNSWLHYHLEATSETTVGLESLARWKLSQLQTPNAEGKTALDMLTTRVRTKARPFYYMQKPEETLLQIERIIAKVEASSIRKDLSVIPLAKKSKQIAGKRL